MIDRVHTVGTSIRLLAVFPGLRRNSSKLPSQIYFLVTIEYIPSHEYNALYGLSPVSKHAGRTKKNSDITRDIGSRISINKYNLELGYFVCSLPNFS